MKNLRKKIIDRTQAIKVSAGCRADGKTLVFTNGCFDLIHPGHVDLLMKARMLGDVLMVGLNTDDSVRRLKGGNRPILDQDSRCLMLAALELVDWVVLFDEDTPEELIARVRPRILVKGGDYKKEDVVGRETVESDRGRVELIPFTFDISTTEILGKIRGESEGAAESAE